MKTQSWLWWVVVLAFVLAWLFLDQTWLTAFAVNAQRLALAHSEMREPGNGVPISAVVTPASLQPGNYQSQAHSAAGWLLARTGDDLGALNELNQSVAGGPRPVDYWLLGLLYFRLNDPSRAMTSMHLAFGDAPWMRLRLAQRLYRMALYAHATQELEALVQADTLNTFERDQAYQWLLTSIDWRDPASAAIYARQAIAFEPDRAEFHTALAAALVRQGQFAEAVAEANRALSLGDRRADVYEFLGNAYLATGQLPEAVQAFEASIARSPGVLWAHYGLAQAYCGVGRGEDAIREFQRALQISPGFEQAKRALLDLNCGPK